ncbi:MAG: NTP transferase domain-containing protein [Alphaproteobacteria bacterium]|nr:NTP transferase domain-containing protein [Alphaproteobacteria bacterium]
MFETVILAGGLGKRLRELVPDLPKPLAPVSSKPFISLLFDQLLKSHIQKVTLAVGYMSEKVIDTFGYRYKDLSLEYVIEDEQLGTGGAIANALKGKNYNQALILNGDSFCNISIEEFIKWHLELESRASLVLTYQENRERYGGVEYNSTTQHITSFIEKKKDLLSGYINAGIYLFSKEFIEMFPGTIPLSLEAQILPYQLGDLHGWPSKKEFIDIGTPDSYTESFSYLKKFL